MDTAASSITRKSSKLGGAHVGTVSLKNGKSQFSEDGLTEGSFEIDMTTINTTDLKGRQKEACTDTYCPRASLPRSYFPRLNWISPTLKNHRKMALTTSRLTYP